MLLNEDKFSSVEKRIKALKQKHAVLASRIEEAQRRPSTNEFYVQQLKKQKLQIKERIHGMNAAMDFESRSQTGT